MKKSTSKAVKPVAPAKAVASLAPVAKKIAAGKPSAPSKVIAVEPKAPAIKVPVSKAKASKPLVTESKAKAIKPVVIAAAAPVAPAKAKVSAVKAPAVKVSAAPAVKAPAVETLPTTTLLAQVDVGFGNTLVVRGEGGGLSWEKGVAMENLDATQWKLVLPSTTTPVVFKFLINDEQWSLGDDYVAVPGSTSSLAPLF